MYNYQPRRLYIRAVIPNTPAAEHESAPNHSSRSPSLIYDHTGLVCIFSSFWTRAEHTTRDTRDFWMVSGRLVCPSDEHYDGTLTTNEGKGSGEIRSSRNRNETFPFVFCAISIAKGSSFYVVSVFVRLYHPTQVECFDEWEPIPCICYHGMALLLHPMLCLRRTRRTVVGVRWWTVSCT